ncbi:MAG: hypothetical protein P8080_08405 [Gammaproteobacteria bacterium]
MNAKGNITGARTSPGGAEIEELRRLIGRPVEYRGSACTIHDVVPDPPVLVLKPLAHGPGIQADSFGKATRRAPGFIEIPLSGDDDAAPDPLADVRLLPEPESG